MACEAKCDDGKCGADCAFAAVASIFSNVSESRDGKKFRIAGLLSVVQRRKVRCDGSQGKVR